MQTWSFDQQEICLIIIVTTDEPGVAEVFSSGEGLVLPKSWSGTLEVPESGVRKIWVSYMDMDGKQD